METTAQDILKLERDLYLDGEAFVIPFNSVTEQVHLSFGESKARALNDAMHTLDAIYPDNAGFTIDDAHEWYVRLGIFDSGEVDFEDMKLAIAAKYSRLNQPYYRQDHEYIQSQLQAAGFNVFLTENRFDDGMGGWTTKTVYELVGAGGDCHLNNFCLGEVRLNEVWSDTFHTIVANYIDEEKDAIFGIGMDMRSTFYIHNGTFGNAIVPLARKVEFRQLLLTLKPAQTIGILFVRYV